MLIPVILLLSAAGLLYTKKAQAKNALPALGTTPIPEGWRRAKDADIKANPGALELARSLQQTPGDIGRLVLGDNGQFAAWTETHFHEPGGPVKPWGLHKGITLLVRK